jgi:two-component system sensor histidine kinase VanS
MSGEEIQAEISSLRRQLATVNGRLADAERAKNEYMQNVAHQLAAPINAIKMNIEALENPRVSFDRKKVLLRSIYSQGTILAHLIKNFSLMSHLEADHSLMGFRDKPDDVNIQQICINYSNDFQPIGRHKNQSIYVDEIAFKKAGSPKVKVIKNLFAQVIYNLLENATKYGDEDSSIVIGCRSDAKFAIVGVTSSGAPITSGEAATLFDRGTRGASAKALHPAGTGFGLYIARRIMEIHGGSLTVETQGEKTTFLVKCIKA